MGRWSVRALLFAVFATLAGNATGAQPWIRQGEQAGAGFGTAIGGGGDINGDGLADLLIGEPGFVLADKGAVGRVLVFLGSTNGFRSEPDLRLLGEEAGARFGFHVAFLGDLDGDGFGEVGVGSPSFHGGIAEQGRVDVYRGSARGLDLDSRVSRYGGEMGMQLGRVQGVGDVTGDGCIDVLTGAASGGGIPSGEGEAVLWLGSRTGLTETVVWRRAGEQKSELFGDRTVGLGDIDHDGHADVLFGTPLYDGATENEGRVELLMGRSTGFAAEPSSTAEPSAARLVDRANTQETRFGDSIASAGDLNGDGHPDLVIGSTHLANEDEKEGVVLVWYGTASGLREVPDWMAEGNEANGHFGTAVCGVGDVNGDGFGDLVVTGRTLDHGEINEGVVAVYFGGRHGLGMWPDWTAESNERGAELGGVVVGLGDANGDGWADFAVGSRYHGLNGNTVGEVRVYWGRRGPWSDGSGWSPEVTGWERFRRAVDRGVARAGVWLALTLVVAVLGGSGALLLLARARRRAQREVEAMRGRLHDYVGAELAGARTPDRRLRSEMEDLRGMIWALKQEAPTVSGLVGYLSDWSWRFAREHAVTLRLDLPKKPVGTRTMDFDLAELTQRFLREALSDAVERAGAQAVGLRVTVERRRMTLELRDDGNGIRSEVWEDVRAALQRWGGSLTHSGDETPGRVLRWVCPYRKPRFRFWRLP